MADNAVQSPKTRFHAYPLGVISDQRMNASHFRMLGAIAGHDRLNANGAGCYASQATLARETALHPSNVPKVIDDLVAFGYLTEQPNPLNRRLRIYRVVYDKPISGQSTVDQSTVNPPEVNSVSGQSTVDTGPISGQRFGQVPDNKQELDVKHMLKANPKAYPEANPAEAAALRAALSDRKTAAIEPLQWGELVSCIASETRFRPESVSEVLLTINSGAAYDEISNRSTSSARRVELFQQICKESGT